MRLLTTTVLILSCLATAAAAVPGAGAIALEFNTSVRAEGMGGAGGAVPWGGDVNVWSNPALLAWRPGVRYERMETHLVPDLADDIWLRNDHLTLGGNGYGLLFANRPMHALRLDMGVQQETDDMGNPTGEFTSWMAAEQWGFGLSLRALMALVNPGGLDRLPGDLDIAGGLVWRRFEDHLMDDAALQGGTGGSASAESRDLGLVVRGTLFDTVGRGGLRDLGGLRLSASGGWSKLNSTETFLMHVDVDQSDPMPTQHVVSLGLRLETGFPPALRDHLEARGHDWLIEALTPFLSLTWGWQDQDPGIAWNDDAAEFEYRHDDNDAHDRTGSGWELGLANVFFLRRGHVEDWGSIDGDTEGWGVQLPFGRWGGLRYDHAELPQAVGLDDVERESFSLWVDVFALLESRRD